MMKMKKIIGTYYDIKCKRFYLVEGALELSLHKGNKSPYFLITADIWIATQSGRKDRRYHTPIAGGCCHDAILAADKTYADMIALHLSDIDGVPMYAFANGYYYLHNEEYGIKAAARHFRITLEQATELQKLTKEELKEWVETQKPRWKMEADNVIKKYNLKVVKY